MKSTPHRIDEALSQVIGDLELCNIGLDEAAEQGGLEHNVAKLQERREIIRGYINKVIKYETK